MTTIGYLGPPGTFTEQALLTQDDLAACELVPTDTIVDALVATEAGRLDLGFVPIENAIEGTVNVAQDTLSFESVLLVQREVVIDIHLHLLAPAGLDLGGVRRVVSHPHALAQVRTFLRERLPEAEIVASTSTAEAARLVGEGAGAGAGATDGTAAVANSLAGELYGLTPIRSDIGDHPDNQTRFVVVARKGVPAPTGHDKTSLVIFQRVDAPGTLLAILQEFAARRINLVKLESRPTRRGLGDYCFIVDLEGHVADEVVGDCLRHLHARHGGVKFLGSYPAAGEAAAGVRRDVDAAWQAATGWLARIRGGAPG